MFNEVANVSMILYYRDIQAIVHLYYYNITTIWAFNLFFIYAI